MKMQLQTQVSLSHPPSTRTCASKINFNLANFEGHVLSTEVFLRDVNRPTRRE